MPSQTYEDILKLHDRIDECVYERDELREKTLPLQAQDNRLRALFKEENWKLREFDEWTARQDPNWQPPPRLPHGRKKRNKRLREMARDEARAKKAAAKALAEQQGQSASAREELSIPTDSVSIDTLDKVTHESKSTVASQVSLSPCECIVYPQLAAFPAADLPTPRQLLNHA